MGCDEEPTSPTAPSLPHLHPGGWRRPSGAAEVSGIEEGCTVASPFALKVMEKASSASHSSVGTGDDFDAPGREVAVGSRSTGTSARVNTATSSTCTETDAVLPLPAVQSEPVAVPSMKGELCVHLDHFLFFVLVMKSTNRTPFVGLLRTCLKRNQGRS
jgi:hypothetical protein